MSTKRIIVLVVNGCLLLHASCAKPSNPTTAFSNCTGVTPGTNLPKFDDGKPPINEPCYEHVGLCKGYPVCCVKYGTCKDLGGSAVSSNLAYYEGGCQSLSSSKKAWDAPENKDCTEQGECLAAYIESTAGGVTVPGYAADVPAEHLARIMVGTTWNGKNCTPPTTIRTPPSDLSNSTASGAVNVMPMLCTAIACLFQFHA